MSITQAHGWKAVYRHKREDGGYKFTEEPVVAWTGGPNSHVVGHINTIRGGLISAESDDDFYGYREADDPNIEFGAELARDFKQAKVEVELVTGRRFIGQYNPDLDLALGDLLCFEIDDSTREYVRPDAIVSITERDQEDDA